jgi:dTDP-D-glucose 4,6-dehydratase
VQEGLRETVEWYLRHVDWLQAIIKEKEKPGLGFATQGSPPPS